MSGTPELSTHSIDRNTFLAVARGRGRADAVELIRAGQLSKRLLLLAAVRRTVLERAVPRQIVSERDAVALMSVYDRLTRIRTRSRADWERLLLLPYLDLWATNVLRKLYDAEETPEQPAADLRGLGLLLAPHLPGAPTAGRPHRVRLDHAGLRLDLWIDDCGPYREVHGEPLAAPLSVPDLRAWQRELAGAWEVLVQRHRWHAEAIAAGLTTVVPLLMRPDGTGVSSAARRAFGSVALSLPPSPVLLALALVHEFMHAQLGALLDLVPMHGPDDGVRYPAPWRRDGRPAGALLQGTYAHLGVVDFWRAEAAVRSGPEAAARAAQAYAAGEYTRWRPLTLEAAGTLLASGQLNEAGTEFTTELARAMRSWGSGPGADRMSV